MMLFSEFAGERTILTFQCTLNLCFASAKIKIPMTKTTLVIGILILADILPYTRIKVRIVLVCQNAARFLSKSYVILRTFFKT